MCCSRRLCHHVGMDMDAPVNPLLANILAVAQSMSRDEFLDILYDVCADMAEEGVPPEELAEICARICGRLFAGAHASRH